MGKVKSGGSSLGGLKRFLGNKNIVTIGGVLACIGVLVFGYQYRVNIAISPIAVPYAKESILTRTLITDEMVGTIKVSSSYLSEAENVVRTSEEVVNKYVSYKSGIPKGSLFYKDMLKEADEMPDSAFANIEDGYTIFSLAVDIDSTYANQISAGQYIDLYMAVEDGDLLLFGKLIESIRVLAVKDKKGNNIIKTSMQQGAEPAELLFAVEEDMFLLLMQSQYIDSDVRLIPVLRNQNYTLNQGETLVTSDALQAFIKNEVFDVTF